MNSTLRDCATILVNVNCVAFHGEVRRHDFKHSFSVVTRILTLIFAHQCNVWVRVCFAGRWWDMADFDDSYIKPMLYFTFLPTAYNGRRGRDLWWPM